MIVYEFKVKGKQKQYQAIDEAIRTSQFIQNKCLRYWMDNKDLKVDKYALNNRQRKEYCIRLAYSVIQSNDLVAYEDLNVKGLVKNRHLAKSISDAGWYTFRSWLEYFGHKYGKVTVAVPLHNTSQNCSNCGEKVRKSLSTRTHVCPDCGYVEDRDINAAINILRIGISTVGHTGTYAWGDLPSWEIGVNLSSNGESLNLESPPYRAWSVKHIAI